MDYATLTNEAGERFVLVPEREFKGFKRSALPELPPKNESGNYPLSAGLVVLARRIIKDREAVGMSQKDLADAAGIRPETLNRIEKGKTNPDRTTILKIDKALKRAEKRK